MAHLACSRLALGAVLVSVLATALLALLPGASAQWVIESSDGGSSIKLGFLAQPQAEWLEAPTGGQCAQNLFLRRFRIIFGGQVSEKWSFFFETDSPNAPQPQPRAVGGIAPARGLRALHLPRVDPHLRAVRPRLRRAGARLSREAARRVPGRCLLGVPGRGGVRASSRGMAGTGWIRYPPPEDM